MLSWSLSSSTTCWRPSPATTARAMMNKDISLDSIRIKENHHLHGGGKGVGGDDRAVRSTRRGTPTTLCLNPFILKPVLTAT